MVIIEAITITLLGSFIIYLIKRHDELDKRMDAIEKHLITIETKLPKRRTDNDYYYSPNSGIDL